MYVCISALLILFYIYAFSRRFYPKRLTVHSDYTFSLVCILCTYFCFIYLFTNIFHLFCVFVLCFVYVCIYAFIVFYLFY